MHLRSSVRRSLVAALAVFASLIAISLVAFSPLALTRLESLSRDWQKLSTIGQTYGAISALLSSFALGAVVVSLLYQARAGHTAREQSIRTLQQQLIRMAMEDPALMTAMGAPWDLPIPADSQVIREYLYVHMWATFWAGNYVVGELTAQAVRKLARSELFNSNAGRRYWAAIRLNVLSTNEGKYRRFAQIVDEEYQKVMASNTPVAAPVRITVPPAEAPLLNKRVIQLAILIGAVAATGALGGRKLGGWFVGRYDN